MSEAQRDLELLCKVVGTAQRLSYRALLTGSCAKAWTSLSEAEMESFMKQACDELTISRKQWQALRARLSTRAEFFDIVRQCAPEFSA